MTLAGIIGWKEVLIVILFLLGIIVVPIPWRYARMLRRRGPRFTWKFRIPPTGEIHRGAQAFFCSCASGEYELQSARPFRLTFRRGQWQGQGGAEPAPVAQVSARAEDLPVTLRVLIRPQRRDMLVTVRHEVASVLPMRRDTKKRLATRLRKEAEDFRRYLRENFGTHTSEVSGRPAKRIEATPRKD